MTHPDAGVLAEFQAGLITGRDGARISAHLTACSRCAGLAADLAELPALLAAVPGPAMPDAVTARLEAVLAEEALKRDSSERAPAPAAPNQARSPRPRRHWDFRLVAQRVLAPAAAVAVLAAGGYGLSLASSHSVSSSADSSGVASAASSAEAGPAGVPSGAASTHRGALPAAESPLAIQVVTSNTDYQPGTLRAQLASELQGQPANSTSGQLATSAVKGCVLAVTKNVGALRLVETAFFQGRPAIVIVVRSGQGDMAWVTTPSCSGPGRHVLASTTLQGTSAP